MMFIILIFSSFLAGLISCAVGFGWTFGFFILPEDIVTRCIRADLILLVIFKIKKIFELNGNKRTLLIGGAATGGLSGLAGSGGPICHRWLT
jgi:hypothetical protein